MPHHDVSYNFLLVDAINQAFHFQALRKYCEAYQKHAGALANAIECHFPNPSEPNAPSAPFDLLPLYGEYARSVLQLCATH